jgi:hypothetical protein
MGCDDLDELEQRLRQAMAVAMRRWVSQDPGWGMFRSAIAQIYVSDVLLQNGMSAAGSDDAGDVAF